MSASREVLSRCRESDPCFQPVRQPPHNVSKLHGAIAIRRHGNYHGFDILPLHHALPHLSANTNQHVLMSAHGRGHDGITTAGSRDRSSRSSRRTRLTFFKVSETHISPTYPGKTLCAACSVPPVLHIGPRAHVKSPRLIPEICFVHGASRRHWEKRLSLN